MVLKDLLVRDEEAGSGRTVRLLIFFLGSGLTHRMLSEVVNCGGHWSRGCMSAFVSFLP